MGLPLSMHIAKAEPGRKGKKREGNNLLDSIEMLASRSSITE